MTLQELENRIMELEDELMPLQAERNICMRMLAKERSKEYIRVNGIKREDVEFRGGDGKPWFGHVDRFIEWLKEHSDKPWCEWNEMIFRTSDLVTGKWVETPARTSEL